MFRYLVLAVETVEFVVVEPVVDSGSAVEIVGNVGVVGVAGVAGAAGTAGTAGAVVDDAFAVVGHLWLSMTNKQKRKL